MKEKLVYSPAEFAAIFGREKTRTYRLLYAGKLECIKEYGQMMIPASEALRIQSEAGKYTGKDEPARARLENVEHTKKATAGEKQWLAWIRQRRRGETLGRSQREAPGS